MLTSSVEGDTLDVLFDLVRMTPAVYKNVLDAGIGEELQSIFDQRGICKRKETLLRDQQNYIQVRLDRSLLLLDVPR